MGTVATLSIGANTYSVYGITSDPVADAKEYFAAHVNGATWTNASADNGQKKALVSAFRFLERQSWDGEKVVSGQATQFPRSGLSCDGESLDPGTPDRLVHGQFELALILISDATALDSGTTRTDIKRAKAGSAEVEYFKPPAGSETRLPFLVHELVGCFLTSSNSGQLPYIGGIVDSTFTDTDFDRSEGFA